MPKLKKKEKRNTFYINTWYYHYSLYIMKNEKLLLV